MTKQFKDNSIQITAQIQQLSTNRLTNDDEWIKVFEKIQKCARPKQSTNFYVSDFESLNVFSDFDKMIDDST